MDLAQGKTKTKNRTGLSKCLSPFHRGECLWVFKNAKHGSYYQAQDNVMVTVAWRGETPK
jgi:hypothetical protein